jgi:hypothetical protein
MHQLAMGDETFNSTVSNAKGEVKTGGFVGPEIL